MPNKNKGKSQEKPAESIHKYFLRGKGENTAETGVHINPTQNSKMAAPTQSTVTDKNITNSESSESKTTETSGNEIKTTEKDKLTINNDAFEQLKGLIIGLESKLSLRMDKLQTNLENNMSNLQTDMKEVKEKTKELETKLDSKILQQDELISQKITEINEMKIDFQNAFEFQTNRIEDKLENIEVIAGNTDTKILLDRIEKLEKVQFYQEYKSRQYNLLFYGIPRKGEKETNEQSESIIRDLFEKELKLEPENIKYITIQNAHRVPRNPNNTYKSGMPDPIIVKFGCISQRNLILSKARLIVKEKHITIRTDLPSVLKEKRAKLARFAYQLRKNLKLKTAIRESRDEVWLETRKTKEESWTRYLKPVGDGDKSGTAGILTDT